MRAFSLPILFALCSSLFPATPASAAETSVYAHVVIAGHRFTVEIADTEASREHGLMFRTHLAADHGMLFIYPDAQIRNFWMKNTLIPLDILFFDANARLINISAETPPCKIADCPTYASTVPARYVLELKAGTATRLHIPQDATLKIGR
ncbi:MAG: DUF192 domain-containing protein [Gammaproteobacteria bacterium]